jgi:hypothetical protein
MPKILRPIRTLVPALLAVLAAGCESSTLSPDSVPGTYVLVSYNGKPLPQETSSTGSIRFFLLADTFKLGPNGAGREVGATRADFLDPSRPDEESKHTTDFAYEINDDRLRVTYICAPNALALCAPGPHAIGRIRGDELTVTTMNALLVFRREGLTRVD